MRIIVTDDGAIWNEKNPMLKPFKNMITIFCQNGKKVTEDYGCLVSDFDPSCWLGMDKAGIESRKYQALEQKIKENGYLLGRRQDIVFLTDFIPESLYPFYIYRKFNCFSNLHLCAFSPWAIEGPHRKEAYWNMFHDLSGVKSLFYMDSQKIVDEMPEHCSFTALLQRAKEEYSHFLPRILYGIQNLDDNLFYFDFHTLSYIPVKSGFISIMAQSAPSKEPEISKIKLYQFSATLGLIAPRLFPEDYASMKDAVEAQIPRFDGKRICQFLRSKRIALAAANHIPFSSEECPSSGPCAGTCWKCDDEAEYLMNELEKIPEEQRIYPYFSPEEME